MKWFPSPAGSSYFSMAIKFLLNRKLDRFPSPAGSSYFSIIKPLLGTVLWSFRPLRGLRISQSSIRRRSPKTSSFPSPAGSSYFSIQNSQTQCFRPLRGLRISQWMDGTSNKEIARCFRPLRGLRISQSERMAECYKIAREKFPSPTGSSYFSMTETEALTLKKPCFRPLRGLRISQCSKKPLIVTTNLFPSPTGSSYFSIRDASK